MISSIFWLKLEEFCSVLIGISNGGWIEGESIEWWTLESVSKLPEVILEIVYELVLTIVRETELDKGCKGVWEGEF